MPVGIWQTDHVNASARNPKSPRERRRLVGILGNADVSSAPSLGTPTSRRHPGECRRPRRHGEWKHNEKAGTASRSCLSHWPTRRRRPQGADETSALPDVGAPRALPGRSRMFTL
jgi:hypothetical protein